MADETITAFGRVGEWFASESFGFDPDIIVTAKGLSSAHAVIGAVIVHDRVLEPYREPGALLQHGNTFGGHPVMAAVALKNLEIMTRIGLPAQVRARTPALEGWMRSLASHPLVAQVRGAGFLWAIELRSPEHLRRDATRSVYEDADITGRLRERRVLTRIAFDDDIPIINVAPPLVAEDVEFETITHAIREVLDEVRDQIEGGFALLSERQHQLQHQHQERMVT